MIKDDYNNEHKDIIDMLGNGEEDNNFEEQILSPEQIKNELRLISPWVHFLKF